MKELTLNEIADISGGCKCVCNLYGSPVELRDIKTLAACKSACIDEGGHMLYCH